MAATTIGLVRRAEHADAQALAVLHAAQEAAGRVAPGAQAYQVAKSRMDAELRRLKAAQHGPGSGEQQTLDAPAALATVLSRWPRDAGKNGLYVKTQSIQITSSGINITVQVPAEADPEPLIGALRELPEWTLQQSQRTGGAGSAGEAIPMARLVLRLVPKRAATTAGGAS
jgi:hypothetical protein